MNLRKNILEITENHQGTDNSLFRAVKDLLNDYKRSSLKRLTYDLKPYYNDVAGNRTSLSQCVMVKGLSERAIHERLLRAEKDGFVPSNENKKLTKEICRVLKIDRDVILKEFESPES